MSRLSSSIALLLLLALVGTAQAEEERDYLSTAVSPDAVQSQGGHGPASELVTGFEAPDFAPGAIFGQNGWSVVLGSSLLEGHVDTANPATDSQHLSLSADGAIAPGANGFCTTSAFSPVLGPQPAEPSQLSADMAIGATGGAAYLVQAQAVNEGFLTAAFLFNFTGDIFALDNTLFFIDTGVDWTPGAYVPIRIEVDPGAATVDYYYADSLIFSSPLIAGTTIDNVILCGDNFNGGESGDFDNLRFPNAAPATPVLEIPVTYMVRI